MNARVPLVVSFLSAVLVFAGFSCVPGCKGSKTPSSVATAPKEKAQELLGAAERKMYRADGMARFWLPILGSAEGGREDLPAGPAESDAMFREAIQMLEEALELDPEMHRARFYLAVSHFMVRELEEAEAWAKSFLRAKPNDGEGLHLLTVIYSAGRQWRDLANLCEVAVPALEATEAQADVVYNTSYFMSTAAIAYFRLGEMEAARKWAERSIASDTAIGIEDPDGYCILGAIQHATGDAEGLAKTRAILRGIDPKEEQRLDTIIESLDEKGLDALRPQTP